MAGAGADTGTAIGGATGATTTTGAGAGAGIGAGLGADVTTGGVPQPLRARTKLMTAKQAAGRRGDFIGEFGIAARLTREPADGCGTATKECGKIFRLLRARFAPKLSGASRVIR